MDAITLAMIKGLGGGGSSLPPVTPSDNGKVLAVENGAWAARDMTFVYAVRESDGTLIPDHDAQNQPSYNTVRAIGESGGCITMVISDLIGYGASNCYMYPFSWDEYTIMFRGTYTDLTADPIANYEIVAALYDMEGDLSLTGQVKPLGKFIVTLTPTALDYSGTMDKTVAEINAAYEAGMEIWFHVVTSASSFVEVPLTYFAGDGSTYNGISTNIMQVAQNLLIVAYVGSTNDGTTQTYSTKIYSLTPAS